MTIHISYILYVILFEAVVFLACSQTNDKAKQQVIWFDLNAIAGIILLASSLMKDIIIKWTW